MLYSYSFDVSLVDGVAPPRPPGPVPLYVHVPFCQLMCPFCVFFSVPYREDAVRPYFRALRCELEAMLGRWGKASFPEVYVGGGTPTLATEEVCEALDFIRSQAGPFEASVEASPYDINDDKVSQLVSAGVTRISLGVQSFYPDTLARIGRPRMGTEDIMAAVEACSRARTVNVDIIFNYPGQGEGDLRRELEAFEASAANQLTAYPLMPSIRGRGLEVPDEGRERELYDFLLQESRRIGLRQDTAWEFSRGAGGLRDEYIVDSDLFVGVGAGAMSHLEGLYLVNTFSLERYRSLASEGRSPVRLARALGRGEEERLYALYRLYGLRLDKEAFRRRFGRGPYSSMPLELITAEALGLLRDSGRALVPTRRGLWAVSLLMKHFYIRVSQLRAFAIGRGL